MPNKVKKVGDTLFGLTRNSVTWAYKVGENSWECAYRPETCRTYLSDYWYSVHDHRDYFDDAVAVELLGDLDPLDEDNTYLFFSGVRDKEQQSIILKNLGALNKLEIKYGVTPTEAIFIDKGELGVIFKGDLSWQSALWKQTLFSFYCKSCLFDDFVKDKEYSLGYYKLLKGKEKLLFPKIKDNIPDIIEEEEWNNIHIYSGVFTILEGKYNKPMTKLLLGEDYKIPKVEEINDAW